MFDTPERRKIVLGITGSIAAYKSAELARMLVSWGYQVRPIMTRAAQEFITPLTLQSVTGSQVTTDFWTADVPEIGHIELADWADGLVIAPATADFIAKLANGFADTPLLAVALATRAPILLAPAMNTNMLEHPKTKENIAQLRARRVQYVEPDEGELACGWNGSGRLADPEEIFYHTRKLVSAQDYAGKHVVVVTGPTREAIDPVRFISNRSSGKMGVALAREAFRRGAKVTMIHGPINASVPKAVRTIPVTTAAEMYDQVLATAYPHNAAETPDAIVMAAAVADFRPSEPAQNKLKKGAQPPSIKLTYNTDILLELGKRRVQDRRPILVGFAVETGEIEDLLQEARRKLEQKKADLIVGNFASDAFDLDTNRAWLVDQAGRQEEVATTYKSRVSNKILDKILKI